MAKWANFWQRWRSRCNDPDERITGFRYIVSQKKARCENFSHAAGGSKIFLPHAEMKKEKRKRYSMTETFFIRNLFSPAAIHLPR
jgi:hypothetical protein